MMQLVVWVLVIFPAPGEPTPGPFGFPRYQGLYTTKAACEARIKGLYPQLWGNGPMHMANRPQPFDSSPATTPKDQAALDSLTEFNRQYLASCQQEIVNS
jgi:hypothetical protein